MILQAMEKFVFLVIIALSFGVTMRPIQGRAPPFAALTQRSCSVHTGPYLHGLGLAGRFKTQGLAQPNGLSQCAWGP